MHRFANDHNRKISEVLVVGGRRTLQFNAAREPSAGTTLGSRGKGH